MSSMKKMKWKDDKKLWAEEWAFYIRCLEETGWGGSIWAETWKMKKIDTCKNSGQKYPNRSINNHLIFFFCPSTTGKKIKDFFKKEIIWLHLCLSRSYYYIKCRLCRSKVKMNGYFMCVNILVICIHYIKVLYDSPKLSGFFCQQLNIAIFLNEFFKF